MATIRIPNDEIETYYAREVPSGEGIGRPLRSVFAGAVGEQIARMGNALSQQGAFYLEKLTEAQEVNQATQAKISLTRADADNKILLQRELQAGNPQALANYEKRMREVAGKITSDPNLLPRVREHIGLQTELNVEQSLAEGKIFAWNEEKRKVTEEGIALSNQLIDANDLPGLQTHIAGMVAAGTIGKDVAEETLRIGTRKINRETVRQKLNKVHPEEAVKILQDEKNFPFLEEEDRMALAYDFGYHAGIRKQNEEKAEKAAKDSFEIWAIKNIGKVSPQQIIDQGLKMGVKDGNSILSMATHSKAWAENSDPYEHSSDTAKVGRLIRGALTGSIPRAQIEAEVSASLGKPVGGISIGAMQTIYSYLNKPEKETEPYKRMEALVKARLNPSVGRGEDQYGYAMSDIEQALADGIRQGKTYEQMLTPTIKGQKNPDYIVDGIIGRYEGDFELFRDRAAGARPEPAKLSPKLEQFTKNFVTPLNTPEEDEFRKWLKTASQATGRNLTKEMEHIDLRGWWKEFGKNTTLKKNHNFGAKYLKPNHPYFSTQSIWSGQEWKWSDGTMDYCEGGSWGSDGRFYTSSWQDRWVKRPEEVPQGSKGTDIPISTEEKKKLPPRLNPDPKTGKMETAEAYKKRTGATL